MPKKILLADDSITIQKVVELTFSDGDYEVSAVNNGAKAIQKLAEMRPDIILSDIIMPEKNGYEVCEYVKSHPEYRNIPVVLLTGTFEPFDPDRAEKAGCDAVVTKPFESQSLIHKVEELIAQSHNAPASAAPSAPQPEAPSPWMEEPAAPPIEPSPFTTSGGSFPVPPPEPYTHGADIFAAAPAPEATTEMPFETPAESPFGAPPPAEEFSGETRAFPKMSFEEMQAMATPPPPAAPAAPEPSPWDEPAGTPFGAEPEAPAFGGETRAFPKMTFDEMQEMATAPAPEAEMPFGAPPPAEEFSGETRAFPKMSFEEMQKMAAEETPAPPPAPAAPSTPEPSPWDEPVAEAPAFGGETRAFPAMSFEDLQQQAPAAEPSPWGDSEAPAFGGETRAFPKMSFEQMQQMASPAPAPEPPTMTWEEPPAWSPAEEMPETQPEMPSPFAATVPEDMPFAPETAEPVEEAPQVEEPAWTPAVAAEAAAEAEAEPSEPVIPPPVLAPEAPPISITRGETAVLTDEQVDRIARRVVELMSDQVVRNIAWEVIPDLAEMVVKERIRQLESEA